MRQPPSGRRAARLAGALVLALSVALAGPAVAQTAGRGAPPPTAFVLDFSNAMNRTLGERPRIDLARDAVERAIGEADARLEVGVVAYGHRRAGDCGDVGTVLDLAPLDRQGFESVIDPLDARGRAALGKALEAAEEMLAGITGRSSIVVVAGGADACEADPCARAAAIEAANPDRMIHVVAVDPAPEDVAGLQCLADATGGLYREARDAQAIDDAVRRLAAAPPITEIRPVIVPGGPVDGRVFTWRVVDEVTGEVMLEDRRARVLRAVLPAGRYLFEAETVGSQGGAVLQLDGRDRREDLVILAEALIDAPATARPGADIRVGWRGPDQPGDYLSIAPEGAPITAFESYGRLSDGNPLTLAAPRAPGTYEIRYVSPGEARLLAIRPFVVEAPEVTLEAPARVNPGSRFEVAWDGPGGTGDMLAIARAEAPEDAGAMTPLDGASPVTLEAPATAGLYELRYVAAPGVVLERIALEVIEPITLDAEATAVAGSTVVVAWTGPGAPGDALAILPAGAPDDDTVRSVPTAEGTKLPLQSPVVPGPAEIRYIDGASGRVLARRAIALAAPEVSFEAPAEASAGSTIEVAWDGPDNRNDLLTVVPADSPDSRRGNFVYSFRGNPAELVTPATPGAAEIRYIAGVTGQVIARRAIRLTPPDVALDAPPVVTAGGVVEIVWSGPDGRNDFITVVPGGTPDNERFDLAFTRQGSPLEVVAPAGEGPAEIRYVSGQTGSILARLPILLTAPVVTLSAPAEMPAGETVAVEWTGPDNQNDFITIVPADAPDDARGRLNFTWRGSPLNLTLPETPGEAEIRYRAGQSGAVLARRAITIAPPTVTLEAPLSATAGASVRVRWQGPDNPNDFITIAEAGAPDDQRLEFNYTRRGNPLSIDTPPDPGQAEIRYHSGATRAVLARRPLTLTEAEVRLTAVPSVVVGAAIEIGWEGPDERNDFITIVPVGSPADARGNSVFTRQGDPLEITVPLEAGPAEIRYRSGRTGAVLARRPIELLAADVVLDAAPVAPAGATIPVRWEGPDNHNDFITIVPEGTPDDRRLDYNFTRRGNPLPIRTPPVSGNAEIRYMSGQTGRTMARRKIELR